MSYSLEFHFDEPLTVGSVARYLEFLRSAGATDDAPTSDRAELTLPAPVVRHAIDMLDSVADSDGDVRSLLDAVEGVRSALRNAIMSELGFPEVGS
ncbi:hypothetical protein ACGFIJ_33120 [Microbispora bryophytorum]|uniref:hypothetical protein n=1 Tax=Microbispora bryophytorum TaxID=1460882 RepID=UPI0037141756